MPELSLKKQQIKLEKVLKKALNRVITEIDLCGNLFSEEALRYIVAEEISKDGFWGNFPNSNNNKRLVFEYAYPKFRSDKRKGTYRPDIASLVIDANGNVSYKNPLAIELKVTGWAYKDIEKCRDYLNHKKGKKQFLLTAVVIAPLPRNRNIAAYRTSERKRIHNLKQRNTSEELKILYAWINPENNKPELFWIS